MGKNIDFNQPLSEDDKEFLRSRGRGYQVDDNERRFPGGKAENADPHETAGSDPDSASFDTDVRNQATHDVGGAPLPGQILDIDTGRVVPLQERSSGDGGFDIIDPDSGESINDPDAFDSDIVEYVEGIQNVPELKKALEKEKIDYTGKTKREELEDALIVGLQDKRHPPKEQPAANDDEFIDPANGDKSANLENVESK